MSIALDLQNDANTFALLTDALAPDASRDDLVEFFERYADTDENGHSLIDVETLADLILDDQQLAALLRPESIRSATPRKGGDAA